MTDTITIPLATVQQALVTLEDVNPSLVCEMAHHPKKDQHGIGQKCPLEIRHLETIAAIKEALAQPPLPAQEPVAWLCCVPGQDAILLFDEPSDERYPPKYKDPLYTTPPPLVQEPVAMRMPKVGDKVICLEDESLGEVVSLTAGGSPDILFADGSHGTYLLREFAELFGYVAAPQQQAEPPPEWPLIKNILAVFGLDAISFVAKWQAAQQQAEPVAYLCENGVGHRYFRWKKPSDIYKPISLYTAPPQRPWQGLTEFQFAEIYNKWNDSNGSTPWGLNQALEAKLKELNK